MIANRRSMSRRGGVGRPGVAWPARTARAPGAG